MNKARKIKLIRRISQILFLALFLFLLANTSYPLNTTIPSQIFFKLSPLISITTIIASRALFSLFWVSIIILALSLVLGRYFCGWVCPFGTTIDIADRIIDKARSKSFAPKRKLHHIKYIILIIVIVTAVFGINLSGWFDPISWSTRVYGLVIHPAGYFLADHATGKADWRPLQWMQRIIFHPQSEIGAFDQPFFQHSLFIVFVFLVIILMGLFMRRFYCRAICPLGAIFALVGRYSLFRRYTSDACIECGNCLRECKMGAISHDGKATEFGECILCFDCDNVCPVDCIYWDPSKKKSAGLTVTSKPVPLDLTRRELIGSIIASFAVLPIVRLALATERERLTKDPEISGPASRVIRPPGVFDEKEFLARCVKCGECMKVCPGNALHPLLLEQGLEGLWTPAIVPRIGYCEHTCILCMEVCPTGALQLLTVEQKKHFVMGRAMFDRNKCIPWRFHSRWNGDPEKWTRKYHCAVCEEHCPGRDADGNKAIQLTWGDIPPKEGEQPPLLYVNPEACIGCGQCENVCPVEGDAAIRISRTADRGPHPWTDLT